ncbi:hypothetical protein [Burkholderia vietnamiensis]|uniref:hypothetical protein n=1 Tax=Burkholderia vietnamiensis TaxID=60552 RepID=UPI001CF3D405|nr:hypothetical protein [Burkholderia vietnamiensis]MCA8291817.1 hypothetical protein [Burkholderia vietnamiensis]HDR9283258.1 hypothetical protein [Burkholderia vietnamiensis]
MSRKSTRRSGRRPLSKEMLLPLPQARTRALSLEHHLALATIASGHANVDLMVCLLKAVYTAFYLRDEAPASADDSEFQRAEAALERCIARAERGDAWVMLDHDKAAVERILVLHDEQLAAVPTHRYLTALDKLNRFAVGGLRSPIPPLVVGS